VRRALGLAASRIRAALSDYLFQLTLLGLTTAALVLISLGTDISIVMGLASVGCATAFLERAHHRDRRR
jgi:hypothetical protein